MLWVRIRGAGLLVRRSCRHSPALSPSNSRKNVGRLAKHFTDNLACYCGARNPKGTNPVAATNTKSVQGAKATKPRRVWRGTKDNAASSAAATSQTFQIRVRLLWAEKPKRGIRCCSTAVRLRNPLAFTSAGTPTQASSPPATPRESSTCYCGASTKTASCESWDANGLAGDGVWRDDSKELHKEIRQTRPTRGSIAATSRAFSTSGLVHWMDARCKAMESEALASDSLGTSKSGILPVDQASSTVFPAKPLFTSASGFSGQRAASRCGYIPLRPGPKFQELLKNGGYKYVSKGLQGRLQDWKRERGVCELMSDGWKDRYDDLIERVRSIDNGMGIYPQAVQGYNDERDYKERDGFKNGWNAAITEYGRAIAHLGYAAEKSMSDDLRMLICADVGELQDGVLHLNMNDTWGWATAWSEEVKLEEVKTIARLFRRYGQCGLYYWVTLKQPGLKSEFHDINRMVEFVAREEKLIADEPSSSKRAYKKLSYILGE